jgi:hypothetical protein
MGGYSVWAVGGILLLCDEFESTVRCEVEEMGFAKL